MICFFSNGEDDAAEGPIFSPYISDAFFLFLIDSFRCSNLLSFSKLVSYRNLFCRIFSVYVAGVSPLEFVEVARAVCAFYHCGFWGHRPRNLELPFSLTYDLPLSLFLLSNLTSCEQRLFGNWGLRNGPDRRFYHTGPGCRYTHYRQTEITDTARGDRSPDAPGPLHPDSWGRK